MNDLTKSLDLSNLTKTINPDSAASACLGLFDRIIVNSKTDSDEAIRNCDLNSNALRERLRNPALSMEECREVEAMIEKQQVKADQIREEQRGFERKVTAGALIVTVLAGATTVLANNPTLAEKAVELASKASFKVIKLVKRA